MSFANPAFLWALFALAIPVLIHLFHFRRYKTVYFTNVRFLREVRQERNNIRQLKRWLLLAARMLALFFLVTAFARPFIKGKDAGAAETNAVSVYLDNSYSMGLKHKGVELLEWGRDRSREIIDAYSETDEFLVLTNDMKIEEQRWVSKQDALNYLDGVELSANTVPLATVIEKLDYLFTRSRSEVLRRYLVSDFQASMLTGAVIEPDTAKRNYLFQLEADEVQNLYIDSVWMNAPVRLKGKSGALVYRVVNSSALDAPGLRVTLKINDQVQSVRELHLTAGEHRTDTVYFNMYDDGWQLGDISLTDYPVTMDDAFYFSFPVKEKQSVLEIFSDQPASVIRRIFADDDFIRLTRSRSDRLNYSAFDEYSLIVLNELASISSGLADALERYMDAGGNVLVIPGNAPDAASYNEFLQRSGSIRMGALKSGTYRMVRPDLGSVLLRDIVESFPDNVALPDVRSYYPLQSTGRSALRPVLGLNNNEALIAWVPGDAGNLFYQAVPSGEEFSDLAGNWFYAPVIYNLALIEGLRQEIYTISGKSNWIAIDHEVERMDDVVQLAGEALSFIPEQRIVNNRLIVNSGRSGHVPAGHYRVEMNDAALAWISYNNDRRESEMEFPNRAELEERFPDADGIYTGEEETLVAGLRMRDEGRPLWRLFLALGIFFLIAETAVLKWLPD